MKSDRKTPRDQGPARRDALLLLGTAPLAGLLTAAAVSSLPGDAVAGPAAPTGPRYYLKLRPVELSPAARSALAVTTEPGSEGNPSPAQTGAAPAGPASATADGGAPATTPTAPVKPGADPVSPDAVGARARDMLLEALRKRPEVVLDLDGKEADPTQAVAELKRRGIKGYEVTLRVLRLDRAIRPPPAGKKFRLLERNAKLSLVGTTFPGEFLALGGDGESTVQIDVGAQVSATQERDVLDDALQDAIGQAVSQAMRKLLTGPMKPPKDPPRRKAPVAPKK